MQAKIIGEPIFKKKKFKNRFCCKFGISCQIGAGQAKYEEVDYYYDRMMLVGGLIYVLQTF